MLWAARNPFLRFPGWALALTALLCVPLILQRIRVRSEIQVMLEGDQRNLNSYQKVRQILSDTEVLVVDLELPEVFTSPGIDLVRRVSEAFEKQPGVLDVKSLTHAYKPVREGLSFKMVPLVPPGPLSKRELELLRKWSLHHPLVRDLMVAEDSRHTLVMVTYKRELRAPESQRVFREEVQNILRPFAREGVPLHVLALPLIEDELRATLRRDLAWIIPMTLGMLALILWAVFRSPLLVGVILFNQAAVLLLAPGLIQATGLSMTVFSVLLLLLFTGVHLTLLTHVYTSLQGAWAQGLEGVAAMKQMLEEVFKSCLFAALTTTVGLLSFTLTDIPQVREIGLLGALGICFVFLMTFGPGLSLALVLSARFPSLRRGRPGAVFQGPLRVDVKPGPAEPGLLGDSGEDQALSGRVIQWVARWRRWIFAAAAVLACVAVGGIARLRTDIRAVEFLSPRSATRQAVEVFDRLYGGINVIQIEFDTGGANGVNDLAFLRYMEAVQRFAQNQPGVSGVYSYAQLLAMMNQIWQGEGSAMNLPDNSFLIGLFTMALKSRNYPFLTALADDTLRVAHLIVRTRDMPSDAYLALVNQVMRFARATQPGGVEVSAANGIHSILEADRRIVRGQERSAGATALAIGLLLLLLWRSARLAFFALVINLLAVAAVMGLAGYAGMPLNSISLMVAALALGITVDDSVHFVTYWRDCVRRGASPTAAAAETLRVKGRPIVATSVALMAMFGLFLFWSFPPVVHFGLLSAVAFLIALGAALLVLPALLLGPKQAD